MRIMIEDKYKVFKKWLRSQESLMKMAYSFEFMFDNFEREFDENKEEEVKKILDRYITKMSITTIDGDDVCLTPDYVNRCYKELKDGGFLK